jgi:DNA-directed RNA polymerase subunit H
MQASEQSSRTLSIYKSRQVILDHLEPQGYDVSNYNEFSINEVNIMSQNKQLDMLLTNTENKKQVFVKYFLLKGLRDTYIYDMIEDLYNLEQILTKGDTLIIIAKDDPNNSLQAFLKTIFSNEDIFIIVHSLKRLQFNLLEHELVPKHTILTEEQVTKFKKEYGITKSTQIPDISRFDPVALAIGMRPGEICHIERKSKIAVVGDYYRSCIND